MAVSGFKPGSTNHLNMASSSSVGVGETSMFASAWSKLDEHQRLTDSGYDSLISYSSLASSLSSSVASTNNSFLAFSSSSSEASNSSSLFSQPSTPVKQQQHQQNPVGMLFTRHNSSTTPDLKHQYVADINAFYLASLRSPAKSSSLSSSNSNDKFSQAFRSCNFGDFSASNSASPVKLSDSPKFVNPDDFIRERDNMTSKLLRSPAFKLQPTSAGGYGLFSPQRSLASGHFDAEASRPFIKSFSSRFLKATGSSLASAKAATVASSVDMLSPEPSTQLPPTASAVRATPTEEEFMEMLIKNRHMPNNPEFLIGRRMGIEKLDILSELNKRSMRNVIDQILSYTTKTDYVRMAGVSREWRDIIQQNKQVNGERLRYLKTRKQIYEKSKENQCHCNPAGQLRAQLANQWRTFDPMASLNQQRVELAVEQKRRNFKLARDQMTLGNDEILSPQDRRLCSLDMNCLNNMDQQLRLMKSATIESAALSSRSTTASAKASYTHREASLLNTAFSSEPMDFEEAASPVSTIGHKEIVSLRRSPLKAINLLSSAQAPSLISRQLKVSPVKSTAEQRKNPVEASSSSSSLYHSTKSPKKMDIIGSKKSKKNLKRL